MFSLSSSLQMLGKCFQKDYCCFFTYTSVLTTYSTLHDFMVDTVLYRSRGSSVSIVSDYGLDDWGSRQRIFPLLSAFRSALGPTQSPVQWVPWVLSPGVKRGRGVMLTTHPHLVPRLRISRSFSSCHPKRLHGV
jgi:hypothetical protein